MADQNNKDEWSNRNWQDAGQFGGGGNRGFGGFGSGSSGFGGQNSGGFGQQNNNEQGGMFSGGLFGGGGSGKLGGGWMKGRNSMFLIIVVLVIIIIYTFYSQISMNASITKSTIERTKIESVFDSKNDVCFYDEQGTVEDENNLRNAAGTFQRRTGVIPYVYFKAYGSGLDEAALSKEAEDFYKQNITDENHFVIFFEGKDVQYSVGYYIGQNAKAVMDNESLQIFKDYLQKFYDARQTNNQTFMSNTLNYTSERIMTTLPYSKTNLIFGCICIAILIVVIIISIRRKAMEQIVRQNVER